MKKRNLKHEVIRSMSSVQKRFLIQLERKLSDGTTYYLSEDLDILMTKVERKKFNKWIGGQTICVTDKGEFGYYSWDVESFLNLIRKGTPTYFD